jgi:hypothetical protein
VSERERGDVRRRMFRTDQSKGNFVFLIGIACLVVAAVWLPYKIYLSYTSFGGTAHMMPVYDAAVYPPVMTVFGLYWILGTYEIYWSWWVYVLLWLGVAVAAGAAIRVAEILGDRPL